MKKAAKDKNLEQAKLSYLGMTLCCFNCHTYVRDQRRVSADTATTPDRAGAAASRVGHSPGKPMTSAEEGAGRVLLRFRRSYLAEVEIAGQNRE